MDTFGRRVVGLLIACALAFVSCGDEANEEPFVGAYSFTPGAIEGAVRQPTRVEAVVGIPGGDGPFPVAVMIHGRGAQCDGDLVTTDRIVTVPWNPPCDRPNSQYIRAAYSGTAIIDALAQNGVAAISIDAGAAYYFWGGEVSQTETMDRLALEHLAILRQIADGTIALPGLEHTFQIDVDRLGLIGHSRGGQFVQDALAPGQAESELEIGTPDAVVLLATAPTDLDAEVLVPVMNVRATCDEDIGPQAGRDFIDGMVQDGGPPVLDVVANGARHWDLTSIEIFPPTNECDGPVDPETTDNAVADMVGAFLGAALNDRDLSLPAGETLDVATLGGDTPGTSDALGPFAQPQDVPMTDIGEQRFSPIRPSDRFNTESDINDV